jgi:hypothetical protein
MVNFFLVGVVGVALSWPAAAAAALGGWVACIDTLFVGYYIV